MSVKELSRYDVITKLVLKQLNGTEASRIIGRSVRQVRRMKARVKKFGAKGLIHKNRGGLSNRRIPEKTVEKIRGIVGSKYRDFGPTFAAEKLQENHEMTIGREKLRNLMIDWKFWNPTSRKQNKEYRSWRDRKEYEGDMIQFDGSYHRWFEERASECCLLAAIDDATGTITKAKFGFNESVRSVFEFWKEYAERVGKPMSVYLDKYSTYKINHASAVDNAELLTQFERVARDLGIRLITAHSPQAKGRVERLFETLQDRLVKELRLANINTIEEANRFLEEIYIKQFNAQFGLMPKKRNNLHRRLTEHDRTNLDHIFSVHSVRCVSNDFTVRFKNQYIQLQETQPVTVLRADKLLMEERLDGSLRIMLRNKHLNFHILPERLKKLKLKVIALTGARSSWTPPANHPWRRFVLPPSSSGRYQPSSPVLPAP